MNTESLVKKQKMLIGVNIITGIVLLAVGILMTLLDINLTNNKAIIGLGIIPFAIAFSKWINLLFIKKYPKEMNSAVVAENDERLIAERNEAEASANRASRWIFVLAFMGYTLTSPKDVFNAKGWWIMLVLLCLSYILPLINLKRISGRYEGEI